MFLRTYVSVHVCLYMNASVYVYIIYYIRLYVRIYVTYVTYMYVRDSWADRMVSRVQRSSAITRAEKESEFENINVRDYRDPHKSLIFSRHAIFFSYEGRCGAR